LSETAFYVKNGSQFEIRWFTPTVEVDLCGHATLAAAHVWFHHEGYSEEKIHFHSHRSGSLIVSRMGDLLSLNFPTDQIVEVAMTEALRNCFDLPPIEILRGKTDYLFIFENESDIKNTQPHFEAIAALDCRGVIISAKGNEADFVSRFFAPQSGVNEDPVTGSAHTTLVPYWSDKLHRTSLSAIQISERRGYLHCNYLGDRVEISGQAKTYLIGEIFID